MKFTRSFTYRDLFQKSLQSCLNLTFLASCLNWRNFFQTWPFFAISTLNTQLHAKWWLGSFHLRESVFNNSSARLNPQLQTRKTIIAWSNLKNQFSSNSSSMAKPQNRACLYSERAKKLVIQMTKVIINRTRLEILSSPKTPKIL